MKKNRVINFFKRKDVIAALSFCLVGMVALGGILSIREEKKSEVKDEYLVDLDESPDVDQIAEIPKEQLESSSNITKETDIQEVGVNQDSVIAEDAEDKLAKNNDMDVPEDMQLSEEEVAAAASAQVQADVNPEIGFTDDTKISWPIQGNVIMNYSMDKSVYFSTLNQYKYNPAIIIEAQVNDQVTAAANGVVESISVNEETGTTVTMDLGDGYKAIYGQLKEVPLTQGEVVKAGATIGYVSEPTKYYSTEGSNLFFELTREDVPVDPMSYLE
jgi:septal ring factor EnvC (AmiA/AmiB activator)